MNWNTKFPSKDGFYIASLNNNDVNIAYFTKYLQPKVNRPIIENMWSTFTPVIAYTEIPKHYLDQKNGWNFSFDGENLPPARGHYLVSIVEQKSYGQVTRVEKLFYEAKKDHWYGLPPKADVIAWRSFPSAYQNRKEARQ